MEKSKKNPDAWMSAGVPQSEVDVYISMATKIVKKNWEN